MSKTALLYVAWAALLLVGSAPGQTTGTTVTSPAPSAYTALFNQLQTDVDSAEASLAPVLFTPTRFSFGGELLNANSNLGLKLLGPNVRQNYLNEMAALKSVGITAIVFPIGFPVLYPPFYAFNGDPADYNSLLAFFQGVVADAHGMGLKVIIETQVAYPGIVSSGSGLNFAGYFPTLSTSAFEAGRATQAATIYTEVKPDFMDLGSEPSTEADNSGNTAFNDPATWLQSVNLMVAALPSGPHNPLVGAGAGNWELQYGLDYVNGEVAIPGLDYIDLHCYTMGPSAYALLINMMQTAQAAGKPLAMSEWWLEKTDPAQTMSNGQGQLTNVSSLSAYSFWGPLDAAFIADMWKVSNEFNLLYSSAFWTRYFWSYVDYDAQPALGEPLMTLAQQAAAQGIAANQRTAAAQEVQFLTANNVQSTFAVVNAANFFAIGPVAPGSIATLFGSGLSSPVTFNDSQGNAANATLLYVSDSQVNLVLPASLAPGLASVSSGGQRAAVEIAPVAPGIFSTGESGSGVAAADFLNINGGNSTYTPVSGPLNVTLPGSNFLVLYGTGFANAASGTLAVLWNGNPIQTSYTGPQNGFAGLDQINIPLPSSLAGAGAVTVQVLGGNQLSNQVQVTIQ